MKNDLYYHIVQALRSRAIVLVSSIVAFFLLLAVPTVSPRLKLALLSASLGIAIAGKLSGQTLQENEDALEDFKTTTGLNRQRTLLWTPFTGEKDTLLPATVAPNPSTLSQPKFDLSSIGESRDNFPNVFVVGAPGSGKTTLAEYLGVLLKSDKRYAVHPHAKPSDFKGFDRIFGGGRNIGSADDSAVAWALISEGVVIPTVAQVIMSLHQLMQERYEQYYKGQENFESIDIYFDEMPAIAAELGQKFLSKYLPSLIMEARKVKIRLWFLSQAFQIRAFGLEGISDLREGATVIRLGKLALNEAHTLASKKRLESSALNALKADERPALVDDVPASIPSFAEMNATINSFVAHKNNPKPKPRAKRTPAKKKPAKVVDTSK